MNERDKRQYADLRNPPPPPGMRVERTPEKPVRKEARPRGRSTGTIWERLLDLLSTVLAVLFLCGLLVMVGGLLYAAISMIKFFW